MRIIPLGKINVPSHGVPVRITASDTRCFAIHVQPITGQVGKTFFGKSAINQATYADVIHMMWPTGGSGGQPNDFTLESDDGGNTLRASEFYVDSQTDDEGAIVTLYQR